MELKLRLAGLTVVPWGEGFLLPGCPYLCVNINAISSGLGTVAYNIGVELVQNAYLERNSKIWLTGVTTWGSDYIGIVGEHKLFQIRDKIKDRVDTFINAYLSVNPKGKK